MNHERVTREPLELVGLQTRASNADPSPIGELWGRFLSDERLRGGDEIVAVYCEYEGDHTQPYTFFLGRVVPHPAEGAGDDDLVRRRVDGGAFARFVAEGEQPAALIETWQAIWGVPFERRYDADYEIHPAAEPSRVEIFVGIA